MTAPGRVPAPLEAKDPSRARTLKAKIRDRVTDVRRHLLTLRTAMAEFGDDFELDAFHTGYASEDPIELNRVKAVERGVDQLYNYIADLAAASASFTGAASRAATSLDSSVTLGIPVLWKG